MIWGKDISGQLDRKYLFSGKSYEKIVQKKDPGIRLRSVQVPGICERESTHTEPAKEENTGTKGGEI